MVMSWLLVYAACIPMPTNEVTKATTHDTHSMARTPESLPDSDEHTRRKKMPPTSTSTDANASRARQAERDADAVVVLARDEPGDVLRVAGRSADIERERAVDRVRVDRDDVPVDDVRPVVERGKCRGDDRVAVAVLRLADARHGLAVAVQQLHCVLRKLHALAERHRHGVGRLAGRQIGARLWAGALSSACANAGVAVASTAMTTSAAPPRRRFTRRAVGRERGGASVPRATTR